MNEPVRSPEPTLRHALRYVSRLYQSELMARLAGHGVSEAEYRAMFVLRRVPDLSNAELARANGVTAQGANQVMQSLIAAGLVERRTSPANARILMSRLTSAGEQVVLACERDAEALEQVMCSRMSAEEVGLLEGLLYRCADGLGAPISEGEPRWNRAQPDVVARRS